MTKSPINRALALIASALVFSGLAQCHGQGTMSIGFDGQPRGTSSTAGAYYESGMRFSNPSGYHSLVLNGGGISPAYPDNDTSYLQPSGGVGGLAFRLDSYAAFGLVSFDLAEYSTNSLAPITVHITGYGPQDQVLGTTDITSDGINDGTGPLVDFQTFTFDARFANLYRVEISGDPWSLDNVAISGVPEPSTSTLVLLAAACAFGRSRIKRRRP
jgi:hypothetical protein